MPSTLSRYRAVSEKWFFRLFRIGFSGVSEGEQLETLTSREFAKSLNLSIYINKLNRVLFRHRGVESTLTTKPTCFDEAEALKSAPPWAGAWANRPTLRQRVMVWLNWLTQLSLSLTRRCWHR